MDENTTGVFFGLGFMILITAVTIVVIWQVAASIRSRAALSREQQYRQLAERATGADQAAQRQLGELNDRMANIQARMASLERVLKQVE
jgi:ABC-type Fe3+-hydroxamate transport system substrate-binding protein